MNSRVPFIRERLRHTSHSDGLGNGPFVNTPTIAGIVLAAGASTRLGTAKQLVLDESGGAMVVRAARQLLEAGCTPVVVVTGAAHEAVASVLAVLQIEVTYNAEWPEGMGSSIRHGIEWVETHSNLSDAVLLAACDMPSVDTAHLQAIISRSSNCASLVASEYESTPGAYVRGIPALFPRARWTPLRALSGDRGARDMLQSTGTLSVFLRNGRFDLDTPSDLARWRAEPSPRGR